MTTDEADSIDGALDAGIEFGLEALPANVRKKVNVEEATALARRRLLRGIFRQHLAEFDESLRGLEQIVDASSDPSLAILQNPELLASMFGLDELQAATIVRETQDAIARHRKPPIRGVERPLAKEDIETVRRVMRRRVRQAVEARAELQGQTLAQEAISTAQQAVFEVSLHQGILKEGDYAREWENHKVEPYFAGMEDEQICPRCVAFHGKRAPLLEPFVSDTGESAMYPGIHPGCRCKVRLVQLP